ncbi:MAG TPA: DUF904 domain-containing protein [Desulfobacteraceae bacterium]|nr:DUF904 domain-containing protein [Desulfobacteraceae bacterium]|tara:strand:+ start:331 stop:603 length:273 start_codon:yes stop_codon:yes gene_type:complete
MKLGNEGIKTKFDDIDIRVDFLIEICQSLQEENKDLQAKVKSLEEDLDKKSKTEETYAEQESLIQAKIDGLLTKLDGFSNTMSQDDGSNA